MLNPLLRTGAAIALVCTPAAAQQQAAPASPAPTTTPVEVKDVDPALWVVKDDDTTIYLFGTVHVLKPGLGWFDEGIKAAFDASSEVVLETVQPDQAAMQQLVLSLAVNQTGPALPQKLKEADRAAFVAAMQGQGLPATAFDKLDPWFAATNLQLLPLTKMGYNPKNGVEALITEAAKAAGKPLSGLETAEQQLGYLDGLSEASQIMMLNETVQELPKIGETIDTMVEAWGRGDADTLAEKMNESLKSSPEIAKVLLTDRNDRWADWIKARLDKPGTVFVAVGAGHLAGKDSVQDLLAKRKLTATRVAY